MSKVLHLIGNGDNATMYKQGTKGIKLTCNLPPFPVEGAWATCMVDFKMMKAINEGCCCCCPLLLSLFPVFV